MVCQYIECSNAGDVKRRPLIGQSVLWYCDEHDPLSEETDADPDLWREVDDDA